ATAGVDQLLHTEGDAKAGDARGAAAIDREVMGRVACAHLHAGLRRMMVYNVRAERGEELIQFRRADVERVDWNPGGHVLAAARRKVVHDLDFVAGPEVGLDKMRTDEA